MKYIEFVANKTEVMQHAFTSAMCIYSCYLNT